MTITFLRLPTTLKKRGRSKSSHYLDIQQGLFTKPVAIGGRATAWPDHEIDILNEARLAGYNDDKIKELVIELEKNRKKPSPIIDDYFDDITKIKL